MGIQQEGPEYLNGPFVQGVFCTLGGFLGVVQANASFVSTLSQWQGTPGRFRIPIIVFYADHATNGEGSLETGLPVAVCVCVCVCLCVFALVYECLCACVFLRDWSLVFACLRVCVCVLVLACLCF